MAKKAAPRTNNTNNGTANGPNKAEAIRQYHAEHPDAGPSDIVKALKGKGIEVTASRVSTVISKKKSGGGLDVDTIKVAAAFAKEYDGSTDEAKEAIEKVGKFIDDCGSTEKALAALDAYAAVAEAIG